MNHKYLPALAAFLLLPLFGLMGADGTLINSSGSTIVSSGGGSTGDTNVISIFRSSTTNSVINTNAETSLYSVVVPANALGTNKDLWTHIGGYYTNNAGSISLNITIKYGSTTVYSGSVGANPAAQVAVRPISWDFHLQNTGSTGNQWLSGTISIGGAAASTGFGVGPGVNAVYIIYSIGGVCAVDSTAQQTFDVRITHGSSSVSVGISSVASFSRIL